MVGIRELKAHLSEYLRRIKKGETIAVSEHGREIALMAPSDPARRSGLWELVRQGKVDWNGGHPDFKNRKLIHIKGKPMSETVIDMRREERY